jgi:hypothetical protein
MKHFKSYDFDREKKIHKVVKSNRVVKHKKMLYTYEVDEDFDNDLDEVDEKDQSEVDTATPIR